MLLSDKLEKGNFCLGKEVKGPSNVSVASGTHELGQPELLKHGGGIFIRPRNRELPLWTR
jgi:hypothetical protein